MLTKSTVLDRFQNVTRELDRLKIGYVYEPQFPLDRLDLSRRIQVRDSNHYAPKDNVSAMATQMANSPDVPPIVVTSDDWLVDGNTRTGAAKINKAKFLQALVIDKTFEPKTTSERDRMLVEALAATFNQQGGQRLTPNEAMRAAIAQINLGWSSAQIGRSLGLKEAQIRSIKQSIDARAKMTKLGLKPETVKGGLQKVLGTSEALALNNQPYRDLALLTRDAGLNVTEVKDTIGKLKEAGSDEAAAILVNDLRSELGNRIHQVSLTGSAAPAHSRQLRQAIGFPAKFEGKEAELVETSKDYMQPHLDMIEKVIGILTTVAELQRLKI
jgi:hypothetical protein